MIGYGVLICLAIIAFVRQHYLNVIKEISTEYKDLKIKYNMAESEIRYHNDTMKDIRERNAELKKEIQSLRNTLHKYKEENDSLRKDLINNNVPEELVVLYQKEFNKELANHSVDGHIPYGTANFVSELIVNKIKDSLAK